VGVVEKFSDIYGREIFKLLKILEEKSENFQSLKMKLYQTFYTKKNSF
jgi:hypothetical protein